MGLATLVLSGLILLAVGGASVEPPVADPPTTQSDAEVGAFLDRLEQVERSIKTITTTIRYEAIQGLLGDTQVRKGRAHLSIAEDRTTRKFFVEFTSYQTSRGLEDERRAYIFDGRYLVERLDKERDFIKREVARQGESIDPLSIDGPFPLPIGQSRASIEKRFTAQLLEPESDEEDRLLGFLRLHLTARKQTDDLDEIDLWYHPETLLPGRAIITQRGGDIVKVDLSKDITVNADIDPAIFSTKSPDIADGWRIDIRYLDSPAPDGG